MNIKHILYGCLIGISVYNPVQAEVVTAAVIAAAVAAAEKLGWVCVSQVVGAVVSPLLRRLWETGTIWPDPTEAEIAASRKHTDECMLTASKLKALIESMPEDDQKLNKQSDLEKTMETCAQLSVKHAELIARIAKAGCSS